MGLGGLQGSRGALPSMLKGGLELAGGHTGSTARRQGRQAKPAVPGVVLGSFPSPGPPGGPVVLDVEPHTCRLLGCRTPGRLQGREPRHLVAPRRPRSV